MNSKLDVSIMVLVLDGNSEHIEHMLRKINVWKFSPAVDVIKWLQTDQITDLTKHDMRTLAISSVFKIRTTFYVVTYFLLSCL